MPSLSDMKVNLTLGNLVSIAGLLFVIAGGWYKLESTASDVSTVKLELREIRTENAELKADLAEVKGQLSIVGFKLLKANVKATGVWDRLEGIASGITSSSKNE